MDQPLLGGTVLLVEDNGAIALGSDGYLTNPIEPRDVLAEVERIVRQG